ncbi:MAG: Calx-beta domain-containing protein [Planctomycetaceae bacterium]
MHMTNWISSILRSPLAAFGVGRGVRRRHRRNGLPCPLLPALQSTERLETRALLAAQISIANAPAVVEGQTAAFQVSLSEAATGQVTVVYSTADGTGPAAATNGSDLTALNNQTLTFSPGQTQQTIFVTTIDDTLAEPTESFRVILQSSTGAPIVNAQGAGSITDNDAPLPTLSIANAAVVSEGNTAQFTVTLSAASSGVVTVQYSTTDGDGPTGATTGSDLPAVSNQTLTFNPGQTQRTISIPTTDDSSVESTETFDVVLSNPTLATIAAGRAVGTIMDNDVPLPALSIAAAPAVDEGISSVFTVTLSEASTTAVTVQYSTIQGDEPTAATSGADYTAASSQTLTFSPGQTQKTIAIPTIDDTEVESDETFGLRLSNAAGATIAVAQATGVIRDNEVTPLTVSISGAAEVTEGENAVFTVRLNRAAAGVVTVEYSTASGVGPTSAIDGGDFVSQAGQVLTFSPGETQKLITVVTTDDSIQEPAETFRVLLSNASGAAIAVAEGIGTINDNDTGNTSSEPTVQSPTGTISEPRPTFQWAAVTGAVSYDVELTLIGATNNPAFTTTVTGTSVVPNADLRIGRYRLWVRANFAGGTRTAWTSDVFQVNTTTTIHAIAFHQTDRTPTITWDVVSGATGYEVFLTNVTTQQQGLINQVVTGTTFTPGSDLNFGLYRVWVRPIGVGGYQAAWSISQQFHLGPTLLAPIGSVLPFRPQFSWTSIPGAASYQVYVSGPSGVLINQSGITGTTFTPATDLPVGDFYWWVRPSTASGSAGSWSDYKEFSTGGLTRVSSPRETISDTTPQLTWPAVPGAQSYEVYVSKVGTPGALYRQAGLTGTTYASPPLSNGDYRVWIRTTTATGSVWGNGVPFTVAGNTGSLQATGISPATSAFNTRPQFTWQPTSGAASYDIYLHNGTSAIQQTGRTGTSWTPSTALAGGDWTWWIRAVNGSGVAGPWSSPNTFSTSGSTALLSPTGTTSDTTPTFSWQSVTGAVRYIIQVDNLTTGTQRVIREDNLTGSSFTPTTALPSGNYRAWVQAVGSGSFGPWSRRLDFTIS